MTMLFEDGRRRTLQNSYLHRRPSLQTRLSVLFFYFYSGQERHQTDLRVARALMLGDCNPMSKVCLVRVARVLRDRLTRVKAVTRNLFRHRFSVPFFLPFLLPSFSEPAQAWVRPPNPWWGPPIASVWIKNHSLSFPRFLSIHLCSTPSIELLWSA